MHANIKYFFRFFRVKDWYYMLGITLIAISQNPFTFNSLLAMVASIFYFCFGYTFNNVFDIGEDKKRKNILTRNDFKKGLVVTQVIFLIMAGLYWLAEPLVLILIFFAYALNILYSVPPMRLKKYRIYALPANGIFFSTNYVASKWIATGHFEYISGLFVFFLFMWLQSVHELEHKKGKVANQILLLLPLTAVLINRQFLIFASVYALFAFIATRTKGAQKKRKMVRHVTLLFGLALALFLYRNILIKASQFI